MRFTGARWENISNADKFSAAKVMNLYSQKLQIEQKFRDEKVNDRDLSTLCGLFIPVWFNKQDIWLKNQDTSSSTYSTGTNAVNWYSDVFTSMSTWMRLIPTDVTEYFPVYGWWGIFSDWKWLRTKFWISINTDTVPGYPTDQFPVIHIESARGYTGPLAA